MEEKLNNLKTIEFSFQINNKIRKIKSKEIDKIKIYNKNIYVYIVDNSIKVYNLFSFKEISNLKLPFNREDKWTNKEFISVEILENDIVIILADKKLYFYEINFKENNLNFLHYLSDVYHFCYLEKRREIFLLTENKLVGDYYGMAKSDILGKVIFRNKNNQPQIYYKYKSPKEVSADTLFWMGSSRSPIHFSEFDAFNNEKYIINIWGVTDNWYYYNNMGDRDEKYSISIYNSDDLKEIFNKEYNIDLRYVKLTDMLFKKSFGDLSIFSYNEKENEINYINNFSTGIYKFFNISYSEENQSEKQELCEYFYLKENMFGIFSGQFLYIVDLSSNTIVKKIEFKNIYNEDKDIKYLKYLKLNGNEYLYISVNEFNKEIYEANSEIIYGRII